MKSRQQTAFQTVNQDHLEVAPAIVAVQLKSLVVDIYEVKEYHACARWEPLPLPHEVTGSGCEMLYSLEIFEKDGTAKNKTGVKDSEKWKVVYSGPNTQFQIVELRPGRIYSARVFVSLKFTEEESTRFQVLCDSSPVSSFTTVAAAPSQPSPPTLASRERKALKLKWTPSEEPGGYEDLQYQLLCSPAPSDMDTQSLLVDDEGFVIVYTGMEKSAKVSKLVPGSRYTFKLKAFNSVGMSPVSRSSMMYTQATVPSMPEAPLAQSSSATSITLQWRTPHDNGSPVTSYRLERDDGSGGEYQLVYAGPAFSATATGLRSGLRYSFRLLAENDEGKSMWSACTTTTTEAVAPSSPTQVTVVGTTQNSATISWHPPDDNGGSVVAVYEVELQAKSSAAVEHMGKEWLHIFQGEATACTINSLRPGCTYRARVRASNGVGPGLFSVPVDVCSAPDVPDTPDPPTPEAVESRFLGIAWRAPTHNGGSKISYFTLQVAQSAPCVCGDCQHGELLQVQPCSAALESSSVQMNFSGDVNSAEIRDLLPGTPYFFRVCANNSLGVGGWSDWQRLLTLPETPGMPPEVHAAATGSTSILVSWSEPESNGASISFYCLEMARCRLNSVKDAATSDGSSDEYDVAEWTSLYDGPALAFEAKGLLPASQYMFRVAASNSAGAGAWSENVSMRTAPASPGSVEVLEAARESSSEIRLSWQPPAEDHGSPVTSYTVEMATCGSNRKGSSSSSAALSWCLVYSGENRSCLAGSLLPGREYQFRIRAVNSCGQGPASSRPARATTLPAPPTPPLRLQCTQRTSCQLKMKWEAPDQDYGAPVTSYQLELGTLAVQQADMASADGSEKDQQLHLSGSSNAATESVSHRPGSLSSCRSSSSMSSLAPTGNISWCTAYSGRELTVRIGDLLPASRYWVRVQAISAAGVGRYCEEVQVTTLRAPPGPPEGIQVLRSGLASITESSTAAAAGTAWVEVFWQPPHQKSLCASPASYEVAAHSVVRRSSMDGTTAASTSASVSLQPVVRLILSKSAQECKLEGLVPGTAYVLRLRSVGAEGAGHSVWSEDVVFHTSGQRAGSVAASLATSGSPSVNSKGGQGTKKGKRGAVLLSSVLMNSVCSSSAVGSDDGVSTASPAASVPSSGTGSGTAAGASRSRKAAAMSGSTKKILAAAAAPAAASRPPAAKHKTLTQMVVPKWVRQNRATVMIVVMLCVFLGGWIQFALTS
ncbi:hypothetical protein CEUSTIGMA_g9326.t1 [Chlamydomonas eustigma]|uniref:Fibronectin type-III domain-containing protein n=1 Tax=Chlamydomonas eustigma TaxID=1157962 RepID=A0A250XFP0_9CHLO|nr:hypothetical protein CEUSTIGMA_g9326.t1 [Chlamydomonas eustigma]|eukprot:GAX81898.1 hypothetical protein CEUSTIGMA_g9326.t1 [Chlamydomonas eustigma]